MIDQSFSTENFRKIFDNQNRKGNYLEGQFFKDIEILSQERLHVSQLIRETIKQYNKKSITEEVYIEAIRRLNETKKELIEKRDIAIMDELMKVADDINFNKFEFSLKIDTIINGKNIYTINKNKITFFAEKQLQYNLKKVFDIKPQNKDIIIPQLKSLLNDNFPKYIIRTDIKSFYESIKKERLEKILYTEPILSFTSKKMIRKIIYQFYNLSGNEEGIPRGIGISSYLSELYLKEFDKVICNHEDVYYYTRYVDDIIIVFSPKPTSDKDKYIQFVENELSKVGLQMNDKTAKIDATESTNKNFEYLGYKFFIDNNGVTLKIKPEKIQKYKDRIKTSIQIFNDKKDRNFKRERKNLINRIRFLTGNTKLLNSKRTVMVGINYSNKFVDDYNFLKSIDFYFKHIVNQKISEESLKRRLLKFSFYRGFLSRNYRNFNLKELTTITKAWK